MELRKAAQFLPQKFHVTLKNLFNLSVLPFHICKIRAENAYEEQVYSSWHSASITTQAIQEAGIHQTQCHLKRAERCKMLSVKMLTQNQVLSMKVKQFKFQTLFRTMISTGVCNKIQIFCSIQDLICYGLLLISFFKGLKTRR